MLKPLLGDLVGELLTSTQCMQRALEEHRERRRGRSEKEGAWRFAGKGLDPYEFIGDFEALALACVHGEAVRRSAVPTENLIHVTTWSSVW